MADGTDLRRELGAFLRTHRESVSPGDRAGDRRRTPGLRREEVAQLCGISTTWYTWIEQGRDIALSAAALSRLASALHLTAAERSYLFEVARRRAPSPPVEPSPPVAVPADLRAVLEALQTPAYLLDRLWHARAWNGPAADLFAPWFDSGEPCLLRFVFLSPVARAFICDWGERTERLIAEFRADFARNPDDAGLRRVLGDLLRDAPAFARLWNGHAVLGREGGPRRFDHPRHGVMRYTQVTLLPATHPDHKIVVLLPAPQADATASE